MKLEVAIGRRRTWYGRREPEKHALVRLAAAVPRSAQPPRIAVLAEWVRRLRRAAPDGAIGPVSVHRSSDPGHWIVVWPWALADRATAIAEGALALVVRGQTRQTAPTPAFRIVEATIPQMRDAMASGKLTSRELVTRYLARIGMYVDPRRRPAAPGRVDHRHER